MTPDSPEGGRAGRRGLARLGLAALTLGALLLLAGLAVAMAGSRTDGPEAPPLAPRASRPASTTTVTAPATADAAEQRARRAPRPVRLSIPSIGVRAPVIALGLDGKGALEVPSDFGDTGWWTGGSRPGERGPAVIVGHVDSRSGPAVFYRLGELRRGDAIIVGRAGGSRAVYHVQRSARYPKDRFPTAAVYGPTPGPTLRLITCSGSFDQASGHYLDNTVVYAGR